MKNLAKGNLHSNTNEFSSNSFILQALILTIASFVSRIIGLVYTVPLYQIIGEEGNGYYGTAYEIYNMLLLITASSMPMAISKIMSVYVAEKDYVNCNRLFRCSIIYVTLIGGFASLFTYYFAPLWVVEPAVMSLRVMAPTIFLSGYLSVFRGYMQAHGTMVPTAISQIIEQIVNAVLSITLAYVLMQYAKTELSLIKDINQSKSYLPASYGATGSALGTLGGVLIALIFMIIFYLVRKRKIKYTDGKYTEKEPYVTLLRVIFVMISPIIFTTFIYNLSTTIDMKLFWWWADRSNVTTENASAIYGIYSRQYMVLINLPVSLASAIATSMMPDLVAIFRKKKPDIALGKVSKAVRTILLVAIPSTVGLTVLAEPIMQLLYKGTPSVAAKALMVGSVSVVFFSVATVLISALQGINKSIVTIFNVIKALVIHVIYVASTINMTDEPLKILVSGSVLYAFVICASSIKSLEKIVGYRVDVKGCLLKPVIASIIMGMVTILFYNGVIRFGINNALTTLATVLVAAGVYFAIIARGRPYTDRSIFKELKMEKRQKRTFFKWRNMLK